MSDRLVDEVNENTMDGDTRQEKWLNAYLTSQYVITKAIPADECLGEARMIIKTLALMDTIDALNEQRGIKRMTTDETAKAILDLPDGVIISLNVPTHSTDEQAEEYEHQLHTCELEKDDDD